MIKQDYKEESGLLVRAKRNISQPSSWNVWIGAVFWAAFCQMASFFPLLYLLFKI